MSNSIQDLTQRLIAYKSLPEPHYQAIGEHLLDVVNDIVEEVEELKRVHLEELKTAFINKMDEISRQGTGLQMHHEGYVYSIQVTKIHKSVAK